MTEIQAAIPSEPELREAYEATFGGRVRLWTGNMPIEGPALTQIRVISSLPVVAGHVAIMPDVHLGKGATVGSVVPLRQAIIPSAVGVDIGCGMCAVQLSLRASDLPDTLAPIRAAIEKAVPVGFNFHDKDILKKQKLPQLTLNKAFALLKRFDDLRIFERVGEFNHKRMVGQLGTLGGGNHFIEVCLDLDQNVWIMLHSGSRNVGKTVGECATYMARNYAKEQGHPIYDKDLCWLSEGSQEFDEYVEAMLWCQEYAMLNREIMLALVLKAFGESIGKPFDIINEAINCHHNYASKERHNGEDLWITRKGAVNAAEGRLGIIPGSMGAKSFIVRGKGNSEAYCSCSHGAGRVMSRSEAKRRFTAADVREQTAGVECRKDSEVVDEIPAAYKDIEQVMAAQADLVEVVATLKQVLCVKG